MFHGVRALTRLGVPTLLLSLLLGLFSEALASPRRSRAVYDAVDTLTSYLVEDLEDQKENFERTAFLINLSDELDPDIKMYVHTRLENLLAESKKIEMVQCFSCEAVRGYSDGNKIVIEKGIPHRKVAKEIMRELSLDHFMDVIVGHTGKHLYLQARVMDPEDNKVKWTKTYKTRALFISDKSFKFSLDMGPAVLLNPTSSDDRNMLGTSIFIGERFYGFGQLGLGVSSIISFSNFSFNQTTGPHIELNINEVSNWHWSWGDWSIYTVPSYALSQKAAGVVIRGGTKISFGNFTHGAVELQKMVFAENSGKKYPSSVFFTIGFNIY